MFSVWQFSMGIAGQETLFESIRCIRYNLYLHGVRYVKHERKAAREDMSNGILKVSRGKIQKVGISIGMSMVQIA